jgi:hypothetical protein
MKLIGRLLLCLILAMLVTQRINAQVAATNKDVAAITKSCRAVQFTLAARGRGKDISQNDDFATAGKHCKRLQAAVSKSDSRAVKAQAAELRPILARLGLPPSTPQERLQAEELDAAKMTGEDLFYELPHLAKRAFDAGEISKAEVYSKQLLAMAPNYRENWNFGNAIFYGNSVLGRIALQRGDVELAGKFLLEAGATPGSPQLNSFGPNMALAKELLNRGQSEVVLEFFGLCRKFWTSGLGQLDEWSNEVRKGRIPEFGSNLNY